VSQRPTQRAAFTGRGTIRDSEGGRDRRSVVRRSDRGWGARWGGPLALLLLGFGGACAAFILNGPPESAVAYAIAQAPADAGVDAAPPEKKTVTIVFTVVPAVKAEVKYGRRRLGFINGPRKRQRRPLIIQRPRDSGPLDVVISAEGFLRVHTRAYTFEDGRVIVKLTPETEKSTLLGYRQALPDAGPDGGRDGGADGGVADGGRGDAGVAPYPMFPAPPPSSTQAPTPLPAPPPAPLPPAPAPAPTP